MTPNTPQSFSRVLSALLLGALLLALLPYAPATLAEPEQPAGRAQIVAPGEIPAGLSGGEWQAMLESIRLAEYQPTYHLADASQSSAYYSAPNRAHGWRLVFTPAGLALSAAASDDSPGYTWGLSLAHANPAPAVAVDGQRLSYAWDADLSEWYINSPEGLEHGFTLARRPAASGDELALDLAISGDLQARQVSSGGLEFHKGGKTLLRYDKLIVFDAAGRSLPASLELLQEGRALRIQVDDRRAAYPLTIDPLITSGTSLLLGGDGAAGDAFGYAISLDGDTALVGAPYNDIGLNVNQGAAYIFGRNQGGSNNWGQIARLTAADGAGYDNFGESVSLSDGMALVGASNHATTGAAYLFERNQGGANNWGQFEKLTPGAAGDGGFGKSVALDNDTALVGAWLDGSLALGSAFIFERNQGGADAWGVVKELLAPDGSDTDYFGFSVALNNDTALVGAVNDQPYGSAYIFERNLGGANNWGYLVKLLPANPTGVSGFGASVALSGDKALVGAPATEIDGRQDQGAAFLFGRNIGGADAWGQDKRLLAPGGAEGDRFGESVALAGDTAAIGAPESDGSLGSAYILERNRGGENAWGLQVKLDAFTRAEGDNFGFALALSGETLLVGARDADVSGDLSRGAAQLFIRSGDEWKQIDKQLANAGASGDQFGLSVSLVGDTALVGAPYENSEQGAAYLFGRNQGGADLWGQSKKLTAADGAAGDFFGIAVSLDRAGMAAQRALVGAYGDNADKGSAYLFERNQGGSGAWGQVVKLEASGGAIFDNFGQSVSLYGDSALIGAPGDDVGVENGQGSAYLFSRNQGGLEAWGQVTQIFAGDGAASDAFGHSVSLSGDTALVGAYGNDIGAESSQGAAYIFERNQGGANVWGQVRRLLASDGAAGENFGYAVSLSGDTALIGSIFDATPSTNVTGTAFIFARNQGGADNWGEVKRIFPADESGVQQFGGAVSLDGDTALVGGSFSDIGDQNDQGAAWVFERNKGGQNQWGQAARLLAPDGAAGQQLGRSVSLSDDKALTGSPYIGTGATNIFYLTIIDFWLYVPLVR